MAEFRLSNFTSGAVLTAGELNTGLTYTSYTPDWTQSVAITKTVDWARYTQFGKMVMGSIKMTSTGTGTADNRIIVSLPVTASSNNLCMGTGLYSDANISRSAGMLCLYETSTSISFFGTREGLSVAGGNSALRVGQTGSSIDVVVASGDIIYLNFQYEAA